MAAETCASCGKVPVDHPFDLCYTCYYTPDICREHRELAKTKRVEQPADDWREEMAAESDGLMLQQPPGYCTSDFDQPIALDRRVDNWLAGQFVIIDRTSGEALDFVIAANSISGNYEQYAHNLMVQEATGETFYVPVRDPNTGGPLIVHKRGELLFVRRATHQKARPLDCLPELDELPYQVAHQEVIKLDERAYKLKHRVLLRQAVIELVTTFRGRLIVRDCRQLTKTEFYLCYAVQDLPDLVELDF